MNPGRLGFALLRGYALLAPTERGGFRLARAARRLLRRSHWKGVFPTGSGIRLDLDLATYPDVAMAAGLYELNTARRLNRLLSPGSRFVDGGANIGFFTCRAARLVGPTGRVDAFEPDPLNRRRLEQNIERNGQVGPIRVHAEALSDEPARLTFHRPVAGRSRNHGESGRFPRSDVPTEPFPVEAARLDAAIRDVPDLVKLDLEGSELLALRGATGWLAAERPPAWIIEHNPGASASAGHRPGDAWRLLLEHQPGYRCWFIGARLRALASPNDVDRLAQQGNLLLQCSGPTP
jgi:FkbM family methyltransferase